MLLPFVKVSSLKQSPIWNLHSISEKIIPAFISNILLQTASYIRLWFSNSFLKRILFLKMSNYLILFSCVMQCEIKETFFMNQLLCRCDYYIKFVFTQWSKKLYEVALELNFKCDFRLFFPPIVNLVNIEFEHGLCSDGVCFLTLVCCICFFSFSRFFHVIVFVLNTSKYFLCF